MAEHRAYGGRNKERDNIWWHGSVSGDMRGGKTGLHLGTRAAAEDALHATIGFPAEGTWDGTRNYYKTLLAGKKRIEAMNPYGVTGRNVDAPDEDYYAHEHPKGALKYSNGDPVPMDVKPSIKPFRITGSMTNAIDRPHADFKANGYMQAALKKGNAKNGYFYKNDGEDYGSISAVVPGPGHIQPVDESDIAKAEGGEVDEPGITAYHGSPHDFERFDMSKIGTGEGNQSYGHGLYFAQNEDVAKGYRDALSGKVDTPQLRVGDKTYPVKGGGWADRKEELLHRLFKEAKSHRIDNQGQPLGQYSDEAIESELRSMRAPDDLRRWAETELKGAGPIDVANPGHMYEVRINAHPDHFLDWDKPFHEQSEHVKNSLRSIPDFDDRVARYGVLDPDYKSKISMGEFINRGVLPHSYDKSGPEFSNAYHAAGIKGVKYLDQGSRWGDKKNPTSNYVVFDDKLVNVKRKYAKGGTVQPSTTVEHTGNGIFDVFHGNKKAGTISIARNGEGHFVSAANLDEPFIGKGIGHEAYNLIEQKIGRKIAPSPLGISPTASKFWIKRLKSFSPEERQQLYQTTRQAGSSYGIPERDVNLRLYGIAGSESLPPIEENSNIAKGKGGSIVQRALMLTSRKA